MVTVYVEPGGLSAMGHPTQQATVECTSLQRLRQGNEFKSQLLIHEAFVCPGTHQCWVNNPLHHHDSEAEFHPLSAANVQNLMA